MVGENEIDDLAGAAPPPDAVCCGVCIGQAVNRLYEKRTIDRSTWEIEMRIVASTLKYPGVRQWWDVGGKTQITPEFAQLIESIDISDHRAFNWNKEEGFVPWKYFLDEDDQVSNREHG